VPGSILLEAGVGKARLKGRVHLPRHCGLKDLFPVGKVQLKMAVVETSISRTRVYPAVSWRSNGQSMKPNGASRDKSKTSLKDPVEELACLAT
jgi:hypothetical protein